MITLAILEEIRSRNLFVNVTTKSKFLDTIKSKLEHSKSSNPLTFFYVYLGSFFNIIKDKRYLDSLRSADYIWLDGFLIGWVIKLLTRLKVERFGPEDFLENIFRYCQKNNKRIFLLGGRNSNNGYLGAIRYLQSHYPGIKVSGHHGYFVDNISVIKKITYFKPDILFVGMGLGKQEKWIYTNFSKLKKIKVIIGIGIFIDFYGGSEKLPPLALKKYNLRWVYRLVNEPSRLWKRYLLGAIFLIIFILYSLWHKLTNNTFNDYK